MVHDAAGRANDHCRGSAQVIELGFQQVAAIECIGFEAGCHFFPYLLCLQRQFAGGNDDDALGRFDSGLQRL